MLTGAAGDAVRAALAPAPLALVATDAQGRCILVEGGAAAALGLDAGALGHPLADVVGQNPVLSRCVEESLAGAVVLEIVPVGEREFDAWFVPLPGGGVAAVAVRTRRLPPPPAAPPSVEDGLTGLPSRDGFLRHLDEALARAASQRWLVAVLVLDLDHFSRVNEVLGYDGGDRILIDLAWRLAAAIRPSDVVARLGSDSFSMICEGMSRHSDVTRVAERLRAALDEPFPVHEQDVRLTASLGLAVAPPGTVTGPVLLRDAEAAMFEAKRRGGARIEVFDEAMRTHAAAFVDTERALRRGLEQGELCVYFQPVVDLRSGGVSGLEALVRWDRPGTGLVSPADFIPVAEQTGLIGAVGAAVLEETAHRVEGWREAGLLDADFTLSVNVSAIQLTDHLLPGAVAEVVRRLRPNQLFLEITESTLVDSAALPAIEVLRAAGARVAVDDFGTGYSSLSYLKRLPVDVLKVDRSFVAGVQDDIADRAVTAAVVALAHAFGLEAVGEGVESSSQLEWLRRLGCDLGQGFYFAAPLPAEDIPALLASRPRW